MPHQQWLLRFSLIIVILSLCVISLGAYTRLTDAGLGCPDWPGCYGHLLAPTSGKEISAANAHFSHTPVNLPKAHTEMTHRYFASFLGGVIMLFALISFLNRQARTLPLWLPMTLTILVIAQGMLGMWTVTLRLLPQIVLLHLLGGFCTLSVAWLCWLHLRYKPSFHDHFHPGLKALSLIALFGLILQILFGGWTSANYAALICPDFPTCQGGLWPDFSMRAFHFIRSINPEDPLGYMSGADKTSIHMTHRLGALIVSFLIILLSFYLWRHPANLFKRLSKLLLSLLVLQICLGISNVVFFLPTLIALFHNGVAAVLLLVLISVNYRLLCTPHYSEKRT